MVLLYITALGLFPETVIGSKEIDGKSVALLEPSDVFLSLFSLFLGQVIIIVFLIFCKNAINTSKNNTAQVQELLTEKLHLVAKEYFVILNNLYYSKYI